MKAKCECGSVEENRRLAYMDTDDAECFGCPVCGKIALRGKKHRRTLCL